MTTGVTPASDAVIARIREVPPLPVVVHQLLALMRDAGCTSEEISRLVGTDQALAARVLGLVNSSFYGLPGRVSTISAAVLILGHSALKSLAVGMSVAGHLNALLPADRRRAFWRHSLATAAGAELIARSEGLPEPEEAFTAGLLHDVGHLILMVALPEGHAAAGQAGALGNVEREREIIGIDHCRAGRHLLQHWKLPPILLECVRLHHARNSCCSAEHRLLATVALADRLARAVDAPGEDPEADSDVLDLVRSQTSRAFDLAATVQGIRERMSEATIALQLSDLDSAAGDGPPESLSVVILSNDPLRQDWLAAMAAAAGASARTLRDWLSAPSPDDTVLICDTEGMDPARLQRLRPLLERAGPHLRWVGSDHDGIAAVGSRRISLVFSASDLRGWVQA